MNGTSVGARAAAFPLTRSRLVALALTAIVAAAMTFRLSGLATYGLSDDEVTKVRATEAYARGDFTVNAEHPMLMKLAIWASLGVARRWNLTAPAAYQVPVEAAVRLPNALVGAASVLVLYGVANAYFGTPVALLAALLLALDPAVTSINRLAKEDTFVVFFFLLAVWLYERGKQIGARDAVRAQPWYMSSAGAFGLMMASKYLPHLYGLYCVVNVATDRDAGPNSPIKRTILRDAGRGVCRRELRDLLAGDVAAHAGLRAGQSACRITAGRMRGQTLGDRRADLDAGRSAHVLRGAAADARSRW